MYVWLASLLVNLQTTVVLIHEYKASKKGVKILWQYKVFTSVTERLFNLHADTVIWNFGALMYLGLAKLN